MALSKITTNKYPIKQEEIKGNASFLKLIMKAIIKGKIRYKDTFLCKKLSPINRPIIKLLSLLLLIFMKK